MEAAVRYAMSFRSGALLCCSALVASLLICLSTGSVEGQVVAETPMSTRAPTRAPTPLTAAAGSEFLGTASLNGRAAADGTSIEALIGDVVCGTTTTRSGLYDVRVRSGRGSGGDFQKGCGASGPNTSTVVFRSGTLIAHERGRFVGHTVQELNLNFGPQLALPAEPEVTSVDGSLIWRDNSDNEDGFRIYITINAEEPTVFEVGANVTMFEIPIELRKRCGTFGYIVTAFNAAGETAKPPVPTMLKIVECSGALQEATPTSAPYLPDTGSADQSQGWWEVVVYALAAGSVFLLALAGILKRSG